MPLPTLLDLCEGLENCDCYPDPQTVQLIVAQALCQITQSGIPAAAGTNDTAFSLVAANTTNATNVRDGLTLLKSYELFNNGVAPVYVKFYNLTTTPNPASDTPVLRIMVPAGGGANLSQLNMPFSTGLGFIVVTGIADTDATAVPASQVLVNFIYGF